MSNTGIVNIRGKEYQTVALRVQKFREAHPDWELSTEIIEANEKLVIMQARIYNTDGKCIATGHAEEFRAASQINSTSALENAETSAIGRALAAAGWGGTEFASANEVQNAIHQLLGLRRAKRQPTRQHVPEHVKPTIGRPLQIQPAGIVFRQAPHVIVGDGCAFQIG